MERRHEPLESSGRPVDGLMVWFRGLAGAVVGGVIGYFAFGWIVGQGFRAEMLPGTFLGLGCSLASGRRSTARGIVCGCLGAALGVFTEWSFLPLRMDDSFTFFLKNIFVLPPIVLIMLAGGGILAYWIGVGNDR